MELVVDDQQGLFAAEKNVRDVASENRVEQNLHHVVLPVGLLAFALVPNIYQHALLNLRAIAVNCDKRQQNVDGLDKNHRNSRAFHILSRTFVFAA